MNNDQILRRLVVFLIAVSLAACLAGCPGRVPPPLDSISTPSARTLARMLDPQTQNLASWEELRPGLERSLKYVAARPVDGVAVHQDGVVVTWDRMRVTLEELLRVLPELDEHPELLAERFEWLRIGPEDPLMTGYYAPYLEASPVPTEEFSYPLYAIPDDMQVLNLGSFHHRWEGQKLVYRVENGKAVPYHGRKAIDFEGALEGQGLEIAWVRDLTDVFFLHIQGSGLLMFPDGSTRHVLYAGKNGHKYVSLGRVLADRGLLPLEGMSMKVIRDFLAEHPEDVPELLSTNPSYVFFRLGDDGPYGAMGKLLTPRVSMATDPKFLPLGSVLAFQTLMPPETPGGLGRPVSGIGLAQDKGGAIKGTRIDYYCGSGTDVEYFAGHIKTRASVHLILIREEN
ncbi:murein transglycosylase A [Desulfovibrio ferrophilus]|uniref:peptidoglycan lytic exotransglycosylase n=1 Tax=Desulfovibrio ferrophilus TaxID=241368 RepID=A0A2Z6AXF6_9BACT|nr:MltA domain-containing protein [Desulfovibrio ferrophilus]BBD07900.1 MltA domain protein [Desulfovibrio ferrophilus]